MVYPSVKEQVWTAPRILAVIQSFYFVRMYSKLLCQRIQKEEFEKLHRGRKQDLDYNKLLKFNKPA